jgi:hypothetical protein
MLMKLAIRIGTVVGAAAVAVASALPASAQPIRGQASGPGIGAGTVAFTGADLMVGLVILATLIVFGWTVLVAGRRWERVTTS